MDHLNAPWREKYFGEKRDECPFCSAVRNLLTDDARGVIFRGEESFAIMNLYPYSPGAFMVIPNLHIDNIENLPSSAWLEMSRLVRVGVKVLKDDLGAKGVNIGMNLGVAAGAGIAEHVHYHLVPRWERDTNFITTIAQTRVNGMDLGKIYERIKVAFNREIKDKKWDL